MDNILIRPIISQDYKELSCLTHFKYVSEIIAEDGELQEYCLVAIDQARTLQLVLFCANRVLGSCIYGWEK